MRQSEQVENDANNFSISFTDGEAAPVTLPLGAIAGTVDLLVNLLEDLFSGAENPPIPRQLMHRRHPLYGNVLGIDAGLIPTEAPSEPAPTQERYSERGNAPSPLQYEKWGQAADWLQNLENLYEFHRGGSLDAQSYGASTAYGNYVFGVYMAAHGYSLATTLNYANDYASWFSHYPAGKPMSPNYPGTPAANIANITKGFNDEKKGSFGLP
ncbi:MAG: hypothetical protein WAM05_19830 [Candidatus Binataceae bacterium]